MQEKIIIIGGGFAGRQASRALRGTGSEILLFDPRESVVMLPALPDLAGGWLDESLLFQPLEKWLPKNVRHIQKAVSAIDLDAKTLIADGETVAFDQLLIAAGSITDFQGFNQHLDQTHPLDSLESALRIRKNFSDYLVKEPSPHLVLAGGGYTGLELAMSLYARARAAGQLCHVTVIDSAPDILPFLPEKKRNAIKTFLASKGVQIFHNTRVDGFDGRNITAGEHVFKSVFFCWTGGSKLAIPEVKGTVKTLRDRRINVNPDLSLPGYPDVFAAGDSAAFEHHGESLRKSVNFAWYQGLCAGKNIARRANEKTTRPFRPVDAGWVIPLHTDSVGQMFGCIWIGGKIGLRLHYFMCGFRNYSLPNFTGFVKIATKLFKKENPHEN